jgi:phosphoglycolate phosphatase-like HAD superfamily hydrolase
MTRKKYVVFDFDGTISTLRCGWEEIMEPLMLEALCPEGNPPEGLTEKVRSYIDSSTGIQTAYQMQWLADEVARAGGPVRDAWYYKGLYNRRILRMVAEKKALVTSGQRSREDFLIDGSEAFLRALRAAGCELFLASGTDDGDVRAEAEFLGVAPYFAQIKGAPAGSFGCSKELVMRRLLESAGSGADMAVVGDGKVEIRLGRSFGALTLGAATDELARHGVNPRKRARLEAAGADVIFGDFTETDRLVRLVMEGIRHD